MLVTFHFDSEQTVFLYKLIKKLTGNKENAGEPIMKSYRLLRKFQNPRLQPYFDGSSATTTHFST